MAEIAEWTAQRTLKLPEAIAARFRPMDRFFVWAVVWQAFRDMRRARAYFARRRPAIYLTSYTTYIEHGIAVRAALQAGVPVRAYGNLQRFGVPATTRASFAFYNSLDEIEVMARALQRVVKVFG